MIKGCIEWGMGASEGSQCQQNNIKVPYPGHCPYQLPVIPSPSSVRATDIHKWNLEKPVLTK